MQICLADMSNEAENFWSLPLNWLQLFVGLVLLYAIYAECILYYLSTTKFILRYCYMRLVCNTLSLQKLLAFNQHRYYEVGDFISVWYDPTNSIIYVNRVPCKLLNFGIFSYVWIFIDLFSSRFCPIT